jgi:hypothetical protein
LTPHYWLGVIALACMRPPGSVAFCFPTVCLNEGPMQFAAVSLGMLGVATAIMVGLVLGAESP